MEIILNGQVKHIRDGLDVSGLVDELELEVEKIAIERNLEIVPRSTYAQTPLVEGDRLEIVEFIGGG